MKHYLRLAQKFRKNIVLTPVASPTNFTASAEGKLVTATFGAASSTDEGNMLVRIKEQGQPDSSYVFFGETDRLSTEVSSVVEKYNQPYDLKGERKPSGSAVNKKNSNPVYSTVTTEPAPITPQVVGDTSIQEGETKAWAISEIQDGVTTENVAGYTWTSTEGVFTGNSLSIPSNEISEGDREITITASNGTLIASRVINVIDMTIPLATNTVTPTSTFTHDTVNDRLIVKWRLSRAIEDSTQQELKVNIRHSNMGTGVLEAWKWGIPAGQSFVEGEYIYLLSGMTTPTIEYHVDTITQDILDEGKPTYNVGTPSSISYTVSDYYTSTPPATGNFQEMSIPDKYAVTYSDSRMTLTNSDVVNGVITVEGKKIRVQDPMFHAIDFRNVTVPFKIIIKNCIFFCAGMHVFGDTVKQYEIEATDNIFFGDWQVPDTKGYGNNALHLNCPISQVIEHNYVDGCGLVKTALNRNLTYTKAHVRYNKGINVNSYNGHSNYINFYGENEQGGAVVPNQRIEWNYMKITPGLGRVEDTINIYHVKCPVNSRGIIANNFLDYASRDLPISGYSGGGIILDGTKDDIKDGGGNVTNSFACENWDIEDNQTIRQANYTIAIALGINCTMRRNRCVVAALFADGTFYNAHTSGVYCADYSPSKQTSRGLVMENNVVGVITEGRQVGTYNYTVYTYTGKDTSYVTGNFGTNLPAPITRATEDQEYDLWLGKTSNNDYIIGPMEAVPTATPLTFREVAADDEANTASYRVGPYNMSTGAYDDENNTFIITVD